MSLTRNASFSLISAVLQIGVTLVTIPIYLRVIGLERYGVVVVVWLLYEYCMLFNLGLDKGTTAHLARVRNDPPRAGAILGTSLLMSIVVAALGSLGLYLALAPILENWMGIGPSLLAEMGTSLLLIALMMPMSIIGTVFRGYLQAHERFLELSIIQLAMAVAFQIVPLAFASWLGPNLQVVLISGAVARLVLPMGLILVSLAGSGGLPPLSASLERAKVLFRYGVWATVTGVISPLMVNLDRFLISSKLGPAAVGLYNIPLNLIMRVQILPTSIQAVLFPRLSLSRAEDRVRLSIDASVALGLLMAPLLIVGAVAIEPFLLLWIGGDVPRELSQVGQVLLLGIWFNSVAYIPYVLLQAQDRPDVIARIHLGEVIPFALCLWFAIDTWGIVGASAVWSARAILDALLLFRAVGTTQAFMSGVFVPLLTLIATTCVVLSGFLPMFGNIFLGILATGILMVWSIYFAPPAVLDLVKRLTSPLAARARRLVPGLSK